MIEPCDRYPTEDKASDASRWRAVCTNDATQDDVFVYAVRTTGIYCRPSCISRRPRRDNVVFFDTGGVAEAAGYRACKRCQPDRPADSATRNEQRVAAACRLIESSATTPTLAQLARHVNLSGYHFHRLFKQVTGVTPHQYAIARRDARLRRSLADGASVTRAMVDAGFDSRGHFHAAADAALGMSPTRYRDGGADTVIRFAIGDCRLGCLLVAGTERGICAIDLGETAEALLRALEDRFHRARLIGDDNTFKAHVARIAGFVETPTHDPDLPLDIQGTVFQRRVWQALRQTVPGETLSYSDLAARIGMPSAVRAVASACGANHLALAIPCHRVVRADGGLGGYRWAISRKQAMLDREAAHRHPD